MLKQKKKAWFKRKLYGAIVYPSSTQGWILVTIYLLSIIAYGLYINYVTKDMNKTLYGIIPALIVATIILRIIVSFKLEKIDK